MSLENWLGRLNRIPADIVWSLWAVGYWSADQAASASNVASSRPWPNLRGVERARDRDSYVSAMAERLGIAARSERDAWVRLAREFAIIHGPHETVDLLDQASRGDMVDMVVYHSPAISDDLGSLFLSSLIARNSPSRDEAAEHEAKTQEIWNKLLSEGTIGPSN